MSVHLEDGRLLLSGDINSETVGDLLDSAVAAVREGAERVDFSAVSDLDSAAVALALECVRTAQAEGRTLHFEHLPETFINLARLYNLSELFAAPQSA